MNEPAITVLLPVHNGARFLQKAIKSILSQSFADFELLIINDGSSDASEEIILSHSDPRIRYMKNEGNLGLIETLNKGIDLARGIYLARMDADDIAHPERLKEQKEYLDVHKDIDFLATAITIINEKEEVTGLWPLDRTTISPKAIRAKMIFKNCISHPSVMGRTAAFKKFGYKNYQQNIEDYDLWLRVLNRGSSISKLPASLLLYRRHSESVTSTKLQQNIFIRHYRMKGKFLKHEIQEGRISVFTIRVFFAMLLDCLTAIFKELKRSIRS